ncbi:D-alanyl-D-alanine carboxypeptidase family protein [Acetobacterium sp.]|uniref:D-alanyl-D-alanine carboxypeptidase family protein n=1 Tax=Acetobacterium sp. TaxID=1872094 RepID=UPI002F4091A1
MKIKNKKRFAISIGSLMVLIIIIIVMAIIGINNQAKTIQASKEAQKAQVTESQKKTVEADAKNTKTQTSTVAEATVTPAESKTKEPDTAVTTEAPKINDSVSSNEGITQVVNKNHSISADFVPDDLVSVDLPSTRDTQLRGVAATALTGLFKAASTAGLELYCCSGYRTYETQAGLYDWNVQTYGVEGAELVSARPGMSEHQMGLAMDVTSASAGFDLLESFGSMPEGQFIKDNAYKYGFIVRYPQGKTDITGYAYEPWHLRYVGVDVATDIYNSGKTMEEYYGVN